MYDESSIRADALPVGARRDPGRESEWPFKVVTRADRNGAYNVDAVDWPGAAAHGGCMGKGRGV